MTLGERLTNLRKKKGLSQEEVADKIGVSRQTISKWETDASTPDFDKIMPLCKLYEISSDELLTGNKREKENPITTDNNQKRTIGIVSGIFLYFISVVWIMVSVAVLNMNPVAASAIFMVIAAIATCTIIYTVMVYKKKKKKENRILKQIEEVLSLITLIIYFAISFTTMAWHLTWIIWIIFGLVMEIIKLIFMLKGDIHEK